MRDAGVVHHERPLCSQRFGATNGIDTGAKKPDAFRIKITDFTTGAVVYDNQMGADDSGNAATVLGGGSIVIHAK